jgi:DUF4097 and DUF4098 domain-containing protein YvlB
VHTFETPDPTMLMVRSSAGHVTVTAGDTDRTTVELTPLNAAGEQAVATATVTQRGGGIVVHLPHQRGGLFRQGASVDVVVHCPTGTALEVRTDAADVQATGTYSRASVTSGSGTIEVDVVTGTANLRTGSGTVTATDVRDALVAATGSGNVRVGHTARTAKVTVGSGDISISELAGDVVTKTGSGDVEVDRLDGALTTKTGSGSLTVRRAVAGSVLAKGASGSVTIGVEEGTAAWLDVSTLTGRVRQELGEAAPPTDGDNRVEITAHTVSGNLRVHRS